MPVLKTVKSEETFFSHDPKSKVSIGDLINQHIAKAADSGKRLLDISIHWEPEEWDAMLRRGAPNTEETMQHLQRDHR